MMNGLAMMENRPLKAPREDRRVFHDPPMTSIESLWASNLERIAQYEFNLNGDSFQNIRAKARSDFFEAAKDYTLNTLGIDHSVSFKVDQAIIVGGHQPELFHAGVWYKNFLLNRLSNSQAAIGINLVVDNDINTSAGVYVPGGSKERPRRRWVPLDQKQSAVPFEHRQIHNLDFFKAFPERVDVYAQPLGLETAVGCVWKHVVDAVSKDDSMTLGEALSIARARFERQFGINNLELPVSHLCRLEAFGEFFAFIVERIEEFAVAYNQSLFDYQVLNKIKSDTHPVPPLEIKDQWYELPFWIWNESDYTRRRLYARNASHHIELSSLNGKHATIKLPLSNLASSFLELEKQNIWIRPRALSMTMFVRMFLSELFVHGIGGAKYDQLTDNIIRRFWEIEPPGFVTATATMLLPNSVDTTDAPTVSEIRQALRNMRFHPEWFFNDQANGEIGELINIKRAIVESLAENTPTKQQHDRITQINGQLSHELNERKSDLKRKEGEVKQLRNIAEVTNWREYSYCLHPEGLGHELFQMAQNAVEQS